jgi:hypothetical protein
MSGYAIRIGSHWLDLFPDQEITYTRESGLLADTVLPGLVTFPIAIPVTRTNTLALGNIHNLQVFEYPEKISDAYFDIDGRLEARGIVIINGSSAIRIDITFTEWDAAGMLDEVTLPKIPGWPVYDVSINRTDVDAPLPQFYADLKYRAINGKSPTNVRDFQAPTIHNPGAEVITEYPFTYILGSASLKTAFQNLWKDGEYAILLDSDNAYGYPNYCYTPNPISLFPYATWLMEKVWQYLGYRITYNRLAEGDWKDILLYSSRANILFNADQELIYPFMGAYTQYKARFYDDEFNLANYVPDVSLRAFLEAFQRIFNLKYDINAYRGEVQILCRADLLTQPAITDLSAHTEPYDQWKNDNFAKYSGIEFAEHDNGEQKLTYRGTVESYLLLPTDAADGDLYYIEDKNWAWYFQSIDKTWKMATTPGADLNRGRQQLYTDSSRQARNLTSGAAMVPNLSLQEYTQVIAEGPFEHGSTIGPKNYHVPSIEKGLSTAKSVPDREPMEGGSQEIILMLFRGIDEPNGIDYPRATLEGGKRINLPPFPGDYQATSDASLETFAPNGIYNTFHRRWMNFVRTARPVTFSYHGPLYKLAQAMSKPVKIHNSVFFISKATVSATPHRVTRIKIETLQKTLVNDL